MLCTTVSWAKTAEPIEMRFWVAIKKIMCKIGCLDPYWEKGNFERYNVKIVLDASDQCPIGQLLISGSSELLVVPGKTARCQATLGSCYQRYH